MGRRVSKAVLLLCALTLSYNSPSVQAGTDSAVLRLNPAVGALLSPNARLLTLYRHDSILDGPVWRPNGGAGYLIFSDIPGNVIDKWSRGRVSTFLRNIFSGKDPSQAYQSFGLHGGKKFQMLGSDGITIDRQGRVVYCAFSNGEIERLEPDGRRTVLASHFGKYRLNAPNDLVYGSDGSLYFTDSKAGTKHPDEAGVPRKGLYVLHAGKVTLLSDGIDHPNGVALSPDERYLYVTNTFQKNILRFALQGQHIANEEVFIDMSGDKELGAPDGIKVDKAGDVYSTGPGGVWIISSAGTHIGTIRTPKKITNMAFGGADYKTLYMTAFGALFSIRLKIPGR